MAQKIRHPRHAKLYFETTEAIRLFEAIGARKLNVRSRVVKADKADGVVRYRVKILRRGTSAEDNPYSLYSLAVQGRRWKVRLTQVWGDNVVLTRKSTANHGTKTRGPYSFGSKIPPAEQVFRRAQPLVCEETEGRRKCYLLPLDEDRIWLLQFDGDECELEIESHRKLRKWPVVKPDQDVAMVSEHDWAPPPPEGGGEDGGGDDDGGDDGEDDPEDDGE